MICPKCGRPVDVAAVICTGCDFILDTEFLGDGILDEEHSLRPGAGGVDPAAFNLADAVILGNIDEVSQSFETSDSGFHMINNRSGARLYVSGRSQALMAPDAIPAMNDGGEAVRLTPFERHVLTFIDGKRPVEVIRKAAGLDESEVKTALATMADKGVIKVVGRALVDFDPLVDTAPRREQRRRVRGSVVGAVAVVGDEADKAIEEAFRTQVRAAPDLRELQGDLKRRETQVLDDADVFGPSPSRLVSAPDGPSDLDADLPSDADAFSVLPGTGEIERRRKSESTAAGALRPGKAPAAVNARSRSAPDALRGLPPSEKSRRADAPSDGFDDFGEPSELRTALVQRDSIDDDDADAGKSAGDVFAPQQGTASDEPSGSGMSVPRTHGIADSRVLAKPPIDEGTRNEPRPSSTSLSDLLSDGAAPPAASSDASGFDGSGEEPTAQLPPPAPQALRAAPSIVVAPKAARPPGVARAAPPPEASADDLDGDLAGALESDADDLDADDLYSDEAETLSARPQTQARPRPAGPSMAASFDDDSDSSASGFDGSAEETGKPPGRREDARVYDEMTGPPPPSRDDGPQSSSELISDDMIIRPAPKPMGLAAVAKIVREKSKPVEPSHVDRDVSPLESEDAFESSTPAMTPGKPHVPTKARARFTADAESDQPGSSDAGEVDERTMKLDELPQKRRRPGDPVPVAGGRGDAVPIPSGLSRVVRDGDVQQPTGRNQKSGKSVDDMRAKARALFQEALADHASGRVGAARMNAKLASIYDPDEAEYREALEAWDAPAPKPTKQQIESRPKYVLIYEEAQDAEAAGDVDRAIELLREGVRLNPNVAAIHNRLGVLLALQKRDYKEAAEQIQRAIELEPDNLHYKSNLGKIIARARGRDRRGEGARAGDR